MRTRNITRHPRDLFALLFLLPLFALYETPVRAQTPEPPRAQMPAESPVTSALRPAARDSELYCAGYIDFSPNYSGMELVGGEQEQEKSTYAVGDFVYISGGAQTGVSVGQEFEVVRPRGSFKSDFSSKRGSLGVYTQEIGRLRVVNVKPQVYVAQVVQSCEQMLLGDLLRPAFVKPAPPAQPATELDRFADPNGKQTGRIVLARDGREMLARDQIVYVDLGAEDNLRAGDRLTIYRRPGQDRIVDFPEEITPTASGGFESRVFKGGKFSNQAQRAELPEKKRVFGPDPRTTPEIKRSRPPMPRKNVGELVILEVQQRTATALITRVVQEIHTGDYVEVQ